MWFLHLTNEKWQTSSQKLWRMLAFLSFTWVRTNLHIQTPSLPQWTQISCNLSKLCTENHISTVLNWEFSELTTFTSPFIMAFSHELQPLGPIVFSGPLQPSTQFSWHGWHSPDASYLLVGQTVVQKGPSFTFLQSVQLPGPGPWHVELHSSWHNIHTLGAALYILYKKHETSKDKSYVKYCQIIYNSWTWK